ncbi:LacI family DNA-binding transcriptional regulator [Saccharothrix deserti]|uniref:LacI family DNA-binding transcriptional regulator n=1 Tax=Saccharothrix deserti TaxID=2593674 RepID=UPI00131EBA47|nr:LacI family DNA-binding transcriptional regulator [Saccharothrix deserti]
MGARRATMRDVAEASGVSTATVSFVLNDAGGQRVSPATRERVTRVARELGYVPHGIAKALREGASRIVLLALPSGIRGGSLDGYLLGLTDELSQHGHVLLVRHNSSRESLDSVVAAVSPRAVIDLSELYQPDPDDGEGEVATGRADARDGGWVDGLAAHGMVQIRHLAQKGHTAVAMAVPDDPGWAGVARARLRFAREAAEILGLEPLATFVVPGDVPGAVEAVRAFREVHPSVSAVAAFDDALALRLLSASHELRIAVPDDLAVIGFDATGYGAFVTPALTTVHIDAESFGRRAARIALGLDTSTVVTDAASVVVRDSA